MHNQAGVVGALWALYQSILEAQAPLHERLGTDSVCRHPKEHVLAKLMEGDDQETDSTP